jgi:hypothetical protein
VTAVADDRKDHPVPITYDDVDMSTPSDALTASWDAIRAERVRAVRAVASAALDAVDCAQLLDMLGLRADEAGLAEGELLG